MPKALTEEAIDGLRRDGFHFPIPGVSESEAASYRQQLEAFEAAHGGALKGAHRFKTHLLFKWLADLVRAPHILDPVEDLIGPNILCWTTLGSSRKRTAQATSPGIRTTTTGVSTPRSW